MNWVSMIDQHQLNFFMHLFGVGIYNPVLSLTGCPHSQILGVNGLVSPSNRLLLLGNNT